MILGFYVGSVLWLLSTLTNACTFKELVFRGASHKIGGTGGITHLWHYTSTYNEDNADAKSIGYGGHYKSSAVDTWDTSIFDKVRLEVIKSGVEHMYFEFAANGTTKHNWMTKDRLTDSSVDNADQLNYHAAQWYYLWWIYNYQGCFNTYLLIDYPYAPTNWCGHVNSLQVPYIEFTSVGAAIGKVEHADEIAIYFVKDGLGDMKPVPNLPWRNPSWDTASVDDKNLVGGLYVSEAHYDMANTVVAGRKIGCGAQRQIWLNDTLPDDDGSFHAKKVCVTDRYNDDVCKHNFTVEIKNCGEFRLYRLVALTGDQYDIGTQSVAYCFDIAGLSDPCSTPTPTQIPNLDMYRPTNTRAISIDDYVKEDWYSGGHYQLLTRSPELDLPGCGAESQIWMKGTFPLADGMHHVRQLCITNRTTGDTCSDETKFTYVKNCSTHIMYYLTTPVENSAYCLDIPSDSNDPPPSYLPTSAKIKYELHWIDVPGGNGAKKPSLRFLCDFDKDEPNSFYYVIYFHVDGNYVNLGSDLVVQDAEEAYVTEETLITTSGFTAGITIACSVGVRSSRNGRTGSLVISDGFYAGIKMMNHSVSVERGKGGSFNFQQTVPFGCMYHPSVTQHDCTLTVYILKTSAENMCNSNTIQHHNKCAKELQGLTKTTNIGSDTWNPPIYEFGVVPVDSKLGAYNLLTHQFVFKFQTLQPHHPFWRNSQSEQVLVNVFEATECNFWQGKRCQVYCDPHMKSFDGLAYELQYQGQFMLFKSENPPMQVQVQITSCYGNSHTPYCACGLVAVAGKDVFEIYTCNGHRNINYKSCSDGVLKVDRKSSRIYKIYLPTGATIRVQLRSGLLDIDITPTVHECKGQISGLCGDLDGNVHNDCVSKGGTMPCEEPAGGGRGYYYHPNTFTQSYMLSEEENLLNVQPNTDSLESYPTSYQMCVCPQNINELGENETRVDRYIESALCSSRQYANCADSRNGVRCTVTNRRISRKRRQADSPDNFQHHNITKRSINITEDGAIRLCTEAMTTTTNEACSDIGVNSSSTEIDNCAADLMLTGDGNWTRYSVDRSETNCLETLEKNTTLQEEYPEISNIIRNNTCPNNCSERGSCSNGECVCEEGFTSEDCSFDLNIPLKIYGLDNDGLCDIDDGCSFVVVEGLDFPSNRNYTCQFSGRVTLVGDTRHELEVFNVSAEHQSLFEIICDLPEIDVPTDTLGIEYNVSVAMEGFDFGDVINFVVINAECQSYINTSGIIQLYMQNGFCLIDGTCHPEGSYRENALCLECKPDESVHTWSNSSSEDCVVSDKQTPDSTEEFISVPIIAAIAGLVFVWLLTVVLLHFCKNKYKGHQKIYDISLGNSRYEEEGLLSIAWPGKDGIPVGTQSEVVTTSDAQNAKCTTNESITSPAISNKDNKEKKQHAEKKLGLITTIFTWNINQKHEYTSREKKPEAEDNGNIEVETPIVTSRYVKFEESIMIGRGAFENKEKTRDLPADGVTYNVSNGRERKTDEQARDTVVVAGIIPETDRIEMTENAEVSLDTVTEHKNTRRKRRRKKKHKLTSYEQVGAVDNATADGNELHLMTTAPLEIAETTQNNARPFEDKDETKLENKDDICAKTNETTLPKKATDVANSKGQRVTSQHKIEEWDSITVIDNDTQDTDTNEIPDEGETMRDLELPRPVLQTSEATGKRKRRKRKRKRKKVAPEPPTGAAEEGNGKKIKKKRKKKNKANNKTKGKSEKK